LFGHFLKKNFTLWFCRSFFFLLYRNDEQLGKGFDTTKNHGHDLKRLNGPQINGGEK